MRAINPLEQPQKALDILIEDLQKKNLKPTLLLHSCCAPCSSYCLEYLSEYFDITIYYYNPNIFPREEYQKRVEEQKRFVTELKTRNTINVIEGIYDENDFYLEIKGLEQEAEGGARCFKCYELRLKNTAQLAKQMKFDYFTTTLSISPYKNAKKLNEIGDRLQTKYEVKYLYADFKKRNGYKRSIELSDIYGLYRQDYCGCIYSRREKAEKNIKI